MDTQNSVSLLLGDELDLTLRVQVRLRARVGREGELANVVLHTAGLELLLGLANPSDLRVGVHNRGNRMVVDMTVASLDVLNRGATCIHDTVMNMNVEQ